MLTAAVILIRAVSIALLARIAWRDFETQKIANRDVLALGALGATALAVAAVSTGSWSNLKISLAVALLLFLALFPFWLLKKVGAGDVKLLSVAPIIAGADHLMAFALLLLAFASLTVYVIKNPFLLPAPAFRRYLAVFDRKGVVPFGVPISASLVTVLLLQAANFDALAWR